ncbi:hypothetical protein JOY44_16950 [Phormidium sp. CLA17]|nr:hypothetical protein [Leptolyngbya sp. Cla-17]
MVPFVVCFNILIGFICLIVAQKLWALKLKLPKIASKLSGVEQYFYRLLYAAPTKLGKATLSVNKARYGYQGLEQKLQKIQKFLSLISLGQSLWRQQNFFNQKSGVRGEGQKLKNKASKTI